MNMFNRFSQGPLMGVGEALGLGASLLGGGSSSAAGSATAASAAAMEAAMEEIMLKTDEYREVVRDDTKFTRKVSNKAISNVKPIKWQPDLWFHRSKGVSSFLEEGKKLGQASYDQQTEQKRSGLKFALGGADALIRKSQMDFAKLAAGDTSEFSREVKASAFGALADTAGFPAGAFENLSAKNLMAFRETGVKNSLAISDFFAEQGTVDPVDPINSIFKLADFESEQDKRFMDLSMFNKKMEFERLQTNLDAALAKAGMKIDFEQGILGVLAEMEGHALDTYADALKFGAGAAGGEELGQAQSMGGWGEALAGIGQQFTSVENGGGGMLSGLFGG